MSNSKATSREAIAPQFRRQNTQQSMPELSKAGLRVEILHFVGEFFGTFMFLFMAFAGCQIGGSSVSLAENLKSGEHTPPDAGKLLYISFAFGMALAVNVWAWARVSGGMFNPAVRLPSVMKSITF